MIKDPAKLKANNRKQAARYRQRHPEKARQRVRNWRAKHRDRDNENSRRWRANNPERLHAMLKLYRQTHPEARREASKSWRTKLADKYLLSLLRRRFDGPVPNEVLELKRRQIQLIRAIRCLTKSNP